MPNLSFIEKIAQILRIVVNDDMFPFTLHLNFVDNTYTYDVSFLSNEVWCTYFLSNEVWCTYFLSNEVWCTYFLDFFLYPYVSCKYGVAGNFFMISGFLILTQESR